MKSKSGNILTTSIVLAGSILGLYYLVVLDGRMGAEDQGLAPSLSGAPPTATDTDPSASLGIPDVPAHPNEQFTESSPDPQPSASRIQQVPRESRESRESRELILTPSRREAAFLAESIDGEWAPKIESLIYQHVTDSQIELAAGMEAECRASTCKLVLRHMTALGTWDEMQPRLEQVRSMTTRLIEAGGPDVQSVHIEVETDADQGAPVTTVYIMREGRQSSVGTRLLRQRMDGPECLPIETCRGWTPPLQDGDQPVGVL